MTGNLTSIFQQSNLDQAYHDAGEVARTLAPNEPAYLFCRDMLAQRAQRFQRGFAGKVSYAVKANPEPRVLQALVDQGQRHFDVASIGEVRTVLMVAPAATLHFNNPIKAPEAIEEAYRRYRVRSFSLDEISELKKIHEATGGDTQVLYTVRFKLEHSGAAYDFGSKFGASPDKAVRLLQAVSAMGARPALTFHPGSQCTDPDMYRRYIETAGEIASKAGVELQLLNVGGGFPAQYLNSDVAPLEVYFKAIEEAARDTFAEVPALMCEPGRGMVATAVSLLSKVIHIREEEHALFVNDGIYGSMQEQIMVDIRLPVRVWRGDELLIGSESRYRVFGPTCDPVDRLPGEIPLPADLRPGDYLEFGLLGAYGSATSTAFNGFAPASYLEVQRGFSAT